MADSVSGEAFRGLMEAAPGSVFNETEGGRATSLRQGVAPRDQSGSFSRAWLTVRFDYKPPLYIGGNAAGNVLIAPAAVGRPV